MMFIISAYAPPTFLKPVLVWQTCQCDDTGEGAHMLGCWVSALNTGHAFEMIGQALADAHKSSRWFLIGEFPSWFTGVEVHLAMAKDMQNGRGPDVWEAGYEPYLRFWVRFQNAPQYKPVTA